MYGAFHPDAQKGGENDTLLTNKAKSGSNSRILVAVGALCAVSGALVGAYALSGSNGYGVSSLMRLGASETCGMDHCLTLLQGPSDQLDSIFQESFDTVCTQANQVVEQGSTHGLKENPKALCTVPKCFDILNAELGKVSKDETKQQSMKDVVITQFYDVCFPTSTAAMGKNKHQTKVAKVGHNAHAVAPKTSTKRSRLGSQCNVDSCLRDELFQRTRERISNMTRVPWTNAEHLQLLRYTAGQFYREHHDQAPRRPASAPPCPCESRVSAAGYLPRPSPGPHVQKRTRRLVRRTRRASRRGARGCTRSSCTSRPSRTAARRASRG